MRSKRVVNQINSSIDYIDNRWVELCNEYNVDSCGIFIIDAAEEHDPERIKFLAECEFDSSIMVTCVRHVCNENNIVIEVGSMCIVNYTQLLTIILEYRLDYEVVKQHLENVMRHEIGHILHAMSFIGRPYSEVEDIDKIDALAKNNMPKMRKNSSCKSLFNFEKAYHSMSCEKIADEMAGLFIKTWAIDFVLANPEYSRKQLGVEEYLTEEEFKEIRKRMQHS